MEFWEGAILVVGGIWLVGRMSRSKIVPVTTKSAIGTVGPQGNTTATNTDGSSTLIAGEPLTPQGPSIIAPRTIAINPPGTPVSRSPILARTPFRGTGSGTGRTVTPSLPRRVIPL